MGLEHPQSSRAVEETRGEVAVYRGQLINALYMSTCGGATEDGEAMFGGPQVPYLKSTECVWESERIVALKTGLEVPSVFAEGRNIAADLARLAALNILAPAADPSWYNEKISAEEACAWAVKAAAAAGKTAGRIAPPAEPLTVFGLGRILADAFAWDERVRTLVGKSEADYVTGDWPELRPQDRPLAAFLLTSGIIPANGGRDDRTAPLSRSRAALMIGRALALSRDLYHQGNFKGLSKAAIAVIEDGELKTLRLAPAFSLLRNLDGAAAPISSVEFTGGEVVKWIETEGLVRLLEVPAPPLTNVLDEPSLYHSWQVRVSREDLESRLNQFYPVGKLIDLVPKKRGASKRLTDLLVIGQEGQVHVTGFKISQVLSLRDNLFVVDREKDADGQAGYFIFLGKGWGHGVGLCQVGAFRMAQKGAAYDEILKKYYRGISLRKEY
jgi:stage II sporulation protein D